MPLNFNYLQRAACFVCLGGDQRGEMEGMVFNTYYSLKNLENVWYAFHLGFWVGLFFKSSTLENLLSGPASCLGKSMGHAGLLEPYQELGQCSPSQPLCRWQALA